MAGALLWLLFVKISPYQVRWPGVAGTAVSFEQAERLCKAGQVREIGRELWDGVVQPQVRLKTVYVLGPTANPCVVYEWEFTQAQ